MASFKDLQIGIDLEPFDALQQNKEEGENYSLSGGKEMASAKWEMNEGEVVRVHSPVQGKLLGGASASALSQATFLPHDQRRT